MAYVGSTNIPNTGTAGIGLFTIKTALKLAGWTVISSGTGTGGTTSLGTPASPGTDLITSATGGASAAIGSFDRANAWVRLREPGGGTREYILQNGTTNGAVTMIIKYSRATGFGTGGSATVAQNTGGGDGVIFYGGGTDASPSPGATFFGAGTGYLNCIASDTPTNGVYGWWFIWYLLPNTTNCGLICTEAIAPGSTPSADNDPSVRYVGSSSTVISTVSAGVGVWSWWEAYGLPGAVYRTGGMPCPYVFYNSQQVAPSWLISYYNAFPFSVTSLDPYTGRVPMFPMMIVQARSNTLPKGFTTETLCFGTAQNGVDTFNLSTSSPKIVACISSLMNLAIPWVPNVVPLV